MAVVKIGWSGGKDSTCATYMHLEQGDNVKGVCYIPMFTNEIPLINKEHYEFLQRQAELFKRQGAMIYFAKGITYYDYCLLINKSGIFKGKVRGYPFIGACGFRRDSKIKALNDTNVGAFDYQDIGIAFDETERHGQLSEHLRSILVEKEITERMATEFCISKNALSPHYKYSNRDGCALCFNAKPIERNVWLNDYPEAIPILIELQEKLKPLLIGRKNEFPLRKYQYFIDTEQLSIFDV